MAAEEENGDIDLELLRRLQTRVREDKSQPKKRVVVPEARRQPGRVLPQIRPLQVTSLKSEASRHSGVRLFLEATAAGKTVADILPAPAHQGPLNLQPSVDVTATEEDLKVVERLFQQRVEEQRRSRQLVQQLNEKPEEVNDDDQQRPDSPGKEYDMQYMQYAVQAPRFRASVHERTLALNGMNSQDRQKFLSSAKDVEESLLREHARYAEEEGQGASSARPKRRRVPKAPRGGKKTIRKSSKKEE